MQRAAQGVGLKVNAAPNTFLARGNSGVALKHGLESKAALMVVPLKISGVGEGIQVCHWQCRVPIAIPTANSDAVASGLETPCVSGSGKHLPIILGLKSMSARNAIF